MRKKSLLVAAALIVAVGAWQLAPRGAAPDVAPQVTAVRARPVPIVLARAWLGGRVTRSSDGSPIAGAVIDVEPSEPADRRDGGQTFITDATGAWTTAIPAGRYAVSASAAGFLSELRDGVVAQPGTRTDIALVLVAGGTVVRGTVSDALGGPAAGARVAVQRRDGAPAAAELVAITDARGAFALTLADGPYVAVADREDYVRATKLFELAGRELVVDFALLPAGTIRGHVVTRAGQPVAAAAVRAAGRATSAAALTGDDGGFTLRGLPPGAISILASARGYASAAPAVVDLAVAGHADDVRIVVDAAFAITGLVETAGHAAIAGARLAALPSSGGATAFAPEPTGDDGRFELVGLPPGSYRVIAASEGFVADAGVRIDLADRDVHDVTLTLGTGATLAGRVEPGTAAALELRPVGVGFGNAADVARARAVHGEADATGGFTLHQVPAGSFVIVARTTDGRAGELAVDVRGDRAGLVVPLNRRGTIEGRVVDGRGNAAAGVHVVAGPGGSDASSSATTDAQGSFRVTGLPAGRVTLVVRDELGQLAWDRPSAEPAPAHPGPPEPMAIELAAGEARSGVVLAVESRDGVIRGRVVDSDGRGVADAWVTARLETLKGESMPGAFRAAPPVLTGADGAFAIPHLTLDNFAVVADGPLGGTRAQLAGVRPDAAPIELALVSLGSLVGSVADGAGPVTAFEVTCRGPVTLHRQITGDDGSFVFDRIAPGTYSCRASAASGTGARSVAVSSTMASVELVLGPWASACGVVTGAPGPLQILTADTAPLVTGADGSFTIAHLTPGSGAIVVLPLTSLKPVAVRAYQARPGEQVELGTIVATTP